VKERRREEGSDVAGWLERKIVVGIVDGTKHTSEKTSLIISSCCSIVWKDAEDRNKVGGLSFEFFSFVRPDLTDGIAC
jgi:hypothetical protein